VSAISWTDHSFTPWFGCSKVSPACDHCYAEAWTLRFRKAGWGPYATRNPAAESAWQKPTAWNRRAGRAGQPVFVFASVNSDIFDNKAPVETRDRLWRSIRETPALVWLVLTKRPQNFRRMLPPDWGEGYPNVWLGVTAENQRETDRRLPLLCRTPAVRRFVSAEPLLEHVDLSPWLGPVSWLICGCESASGKRPGQRPTDLAWVRSLRDQCQAAGVSLWLKQLVQNGKLVETPELDGRAWTERPEAAAMT
jgi:protein gp37